MMTTYDEYSSMYARLQAGEITEETWMSFCMEVLKEILEQPDTQQIMIRLKYR